MKASADVDEIWKTLGTWGRYQVQQLLLTMVTYAPCGFHLLSMVFIGYRPPSECQQLSNESRAEHGIYNDNNVSYSVAYDKCDIYLGKNTTNGTETYSLSCLDGFNFSRPKDSTIVTEWDLVCDRSELPQIAQMLVMIGQGVGAATLPSFSDRFGRKPVHCLSHVAILVIALVTVFAPNFVVLAVLRLLVGIAQQGVVMTQVVITVERAPANQRFLVMWVSGQFWTVGMMVMSLMAYLMQDLSWRYFQLALTLYSIVALSEFFFLDESVRWLLANGKEEQAMKILRRAAKKNNVSFEKIQALLKDKEDSEHLHEGKLNIDAKENGLLNVASNEVAAVKSTPIDFKDTEEPHPAEVRRYTVLDILKRKRLFLMSLIVWYMWIVNSLVYYGLFLIAGSFSGNRFLNFFLSAVADIPGDILFFTVIKCCGRKTGLIILHALVGLCLISGTLCLTFEDRHSSLPTLAFVLSLLGKMTISSSWGLVFLYTPELYPTNLRNAGLGLSSSLSRIGGMLSPFSQTLFDRISWGPGAIFGGMCMLVTVLVPFLPETKGVQLPTTLQELKSWNKPADTKEWTPIPTISQQNVDKQEFVYNTHM